MPTPLDIRLIPRIKAIIARFGKSVTVRSVAGESYVASTGIESGTTTTPSIIISPPVPADEKYFDPLKIEVGDTMVFVAAQGLTITIQNGLQLIIDTQVWTTVEVKTFYTGELIGLYGLHLRR